jgi:alpha-glucosidase
MTGAERDAYVGMRSTNTYQPMPRKNALGQTVTPKPVSVDMMPEDLRRDYGIDPFYKKYLKVNGIVVMGSMRVTDYAFLEAAYTLDHQFSESPEWVREMFDRLKIRLAILSVVEFTMDLPENYNNPGNSGLAEALFQDGRSRGLGGMPWCSCGEENLLNLRGDRYGGRDGLQGQGENITIHEFSHTTASAIRAVQATYARNANGRRVLQDEGPFWTKLRKAFADAKAEGGRLKKWNDEHPRPDGSPGKVYASVDEQEYWAEGAQAWFNNANPGNSGGLSTREDVKAKDPLLAALLTEIYGDGPWRYIKTTATNRDGTPMRPTSELAHLAGIDRSKIPVFNNNNSPRVQAATTQPGRERGRGQGGG